MLKGAHAMLLDFNRPLTFKLDGCDCDHSRSADVALLRNWQQGVVHSAAEGSAVFKLGIIVIADMSKDNSITSLP